jgi:PEP-CTERM motif
MKIQIAALTALATVALAPSANATILTLFDSWQNGIANFDSTVAGAGATLNTISLTAGDSGTPLVLPGVTISRNNGSGVSVGSTYNAGGVDSSGGMIDISPDGSGPDIGGIGSGITFTFASAVNSFGFEVGDWGTCCEPSGLYISFDGGAPILVGLADGIANVFLTNGGPGVFVAALDDSSSFTTVQFWGDGYGEFLVAGGTLRFANVGQGTLVPEPATFGLLGLGLLGLGLSRRRKAA